MNMYTFNHILYLSTSSTTVLRNMFTYWNQMKKANTNIIAYNGILWPHFIIKVLF